MISTTGLSVAGGVSSSGIVQIGLDSQLARLHQQLSDCVNCSTANTAEGQAKAQALSDQINSLKARLDSPSPAGPNPLQEAQAASGSQFSFQNRPIPGEPVGSVINISV